MSARIVHEPLFRIGIALGAAVLVFSTVYVLRPADSVSRAEPQPPGPNVLPSPDTNVATPYAYGAWLNEENQKGPFEGELNGLRILPLGDPNERVTCPPNGWTELSKGPALDFAANDRELGIRLPDLPPGIVPLNIPTIFTCGSEGEASSWLFSVAPGTAGMGTTGGTIRIDRTRNRDFVVFAASEDRWQSHSVAGLEGVKARPIHVENGAVLGQCYAAIRDTDSLVVTMVTGSGAMLSS